MKKKIALKIALTTGEILKKKSDINVIYTRKKDVFIGLIKRAEIAKLQIINKKILSISQNI